MRILIICILILFLTIPLGMVKGVIESRVFLFLATVGEISNDWGGSQEIIAPVIIVPTERVVTKPVHGLQGAAEGTRQEVVSESIFILPETLVVDANVQPDVRHRGIFDVLVHTTDVKMTGGFTKQDLSLIPSGTRILWDKAVLSIGVNPSLIRGEPNMTFADKELKLTPGSMMQGVEGVNAVIPLKDGDLDQAFELSFRFNGSRMISFAPLGQKNTFKMVSSWPHPIFEGTYRPENPVISEKGFEASWNIPYIARDYPQAGYISSERQPFQDKMASVGLFEEMAAHRQTERLAKYGIMFITLTFIMMFLFEVQLKRQMHYVQYGVIGLAVSLFFLVTLSLCEHIAFGAAYALASITVLAMIGLYIYAVLNNKRIAFIGAFLMAFLYAVLYVMLSEAQYALLIGTFILLSVMAAIMWATRGLNQIKPDTTDLVTIPKKKGKR